MDELSQVIFNAIIQREPEALSETDKGFLKARRAYLNREQRDKYRAILKEEAIVEKEESIEGATRSDRKSYRELQKKAAELGLEKVVGVQREELELFIKTAEGPAGA